MNRAQISEQVFGRVWPRVLELIHRPIMQRIQGMGLSVFDCRIDIGLRWGLIEGVRAEMLRDLLAKTRREQR